MPRLKSPTSVAEGPRTVEYRLRVKDMPLEMRPRERLKKFGAGSLSDAELLAIVLRTGSTRHNVHDLAREVLTLSRGLGGLDRASLVEMQAAHGLGEVKSIEIRAALELGKRVVSLHPTQRAQVTSPLDIYHLVSGDMGTLEQEHLRVLLLDTKNHVLSAPDLYRGSLNSTTVRIGELFRDAIRQNAASIALVHNHPSGDPTPSPQDVALTREAVAAGALLDIEVLDHVVVGRGGDKPYVSLKERGLGFAVSR